MTFKIAIPNNIPFPVQQEIINPPQDYDFPDWYGFALPNDWKRFIHKSLRNDWQILGPHERYRLAAQAQWMANHFIFESMENKNASST